MTRACDETTRRLASGSRLALLPGIRQGKSHGARRRQRLHRSIVNQAIVRLLERPEVYLTWQGPFIASKLAPVKRHNDFSKVRRVLDVGCGPGTNSGEFAGVDYLGVDLNSSYVSYASRRHGPRFAVADVRTDSIPGQGEYDFVLVNSLLHHLDDNAVAALLEGIPRYLSDEGHIHVIELELPEQRGLARTLALSDRGAYPRSLEAWHELLTDRFEDVIFEPFPVPNRGPALWRMLYFKGKPRPA
jgi:SAM-dependent methyltransferase